MNLVSASVWRCGRNSDPALVDVGRLFRLHYLLLWLLVGCRGRESDRRFRDGILQQAPKRAKSVLPADFLALFVSAAPIADADLINSQAALGYLYRDFGLKAKALLLDWNGLDNLTTEYLVAGF